MVGPADYDPMIGGDSGTVFLRHYASFDQSTGRQGVRTVRPNVIKAWMVPVIGVLMFAVPGCGGTACTRELRASRVNIDLSAVTGPTGEALTAKGCVDGDCREQNVALSREWGYLWEPGSKGKGTHTVTVTLTTADGQVIFDGSVTAQTTDVSRDPGGPCFQEAWSLNLKPQGSNTLQVVA